MEYTTQMDAARKGIVTPQMATVAEKEKCLLKTHGTCCFRQGCDSC